MSALSLAPATSSSSWPIMSIRRSFSTSSASSSSTTSSIYSRTADDLLDRLASQDAHSTLHLWSAGNIRLSSSMDLTVPIQEAIELIRAMKRDPRFELVNTHYFGHDEDDWKISFRRTAFSYPPSTPPLCNPDVE